MSDLSRLVWIMAALAASGLAGFLLLVVIAQGAKLHRLRQLLRERDDQLAELEAALGPNIRFLKGERRG